jgi:hypothetical protein
MEREIETARPNPGVGLGWRLTSNGRRDRDRGAPLRHCRRYPVREHSRPVDVDRLLAESDVVAARIGGGA